MLPPRRRACRPRTGRNVRGRCPDASRDDSAQRAGHARPRAVCVGHQLRVPRTSHAGAMSPAFLLPAKVSELRDAGDVLIHVAPPCAAISYVLLPVVVRSRSLEGSRRGTGGWRSWVSTSSVPLIVCALVMAHSSPFVSLSYCQRGDAVVPYKLCASLATEKTLTSCDVRSPVRTLTDGAPSWSTDRLTMLHQKKPRKPEVLQFMASLVKGTPISAVPCWVGLSRCDMTRMQSLHVRARPVLLAQK